MITLKIALATHNTLIEGFGGASGIRDARSLEAALARPYATFDQQELYSTGIDKAASILESIIINHPFVDGNKRTAYGLMQLVLADYQLTVEVSEEEQYTFVIAASMGEIRYNEIKTWLEANTTKL
ncbi:type II toxin-antitoxin system death-on-curing family toxin [Mucilaginibacter myungsuensis]|uniref:Type II toxin-antitoxin system death-on-curing family toxin n=1 Tax=Mucilaginibacter myungsuensis TaxID=649104 RepID=A0A929PW63_9SPHI|nr:type II toxin-antitoxin system death-on-curing family toxin [Mucilaginibacter myungsuensis]MBE9662493.1 type II toxin-antitoxin system death-on-curing family toxin [Mucilaginibacter myungsuensis]MDN3597912.1 type II toxin-antitoxin system death-on-curing family toxin [Mucilaginibacter myungsuensis]